MVAFVGAVICIIAAVHTGSSKVVDPPPPPQHQPDNKSLYAGSASASAAQTTPAAPRRSGSGSVARAGPLVGALHGAETPTFTAGVGVTGLSGHDPRVNRLVCTPIPAGECEPRNFLQQAAAEEEEDDEKPTSSLADDGGGGEQHNSAGQLRTAAGELRRTIRQQKEQIVTDRRTITELSGKLTDCEREQGGGGGGGGRGVAGMRGAKGGGGGGGGGGKRRQHDQIMVRDSPSSGPTPDPVHLLTVRAVDELEQAISQLKDRIGKLEVGVSLEVYRQIIFISSYFSLEYPLGR